ncbi:MAG TPA: hypothetical protein VNH15_05980 [Elusimicrobiota bacterium]|nr:hypothetical protein [Elusimicrobiota bacterium]
MRFPILKPFLAACAALALCLGLAPGTRGETPAPGAFRDVMRAQADAAPSSSSVPAYQRLSRTSESYLCEYGFTSFNRDKWDIHFSLSRAGLARYENLFGYTQSGLNRLESWKASALRAGTPASEAQAEYQGKLVSYFARHGFEIAGPRTVEVDMPAQIKENTAPLKSVADIFARVGARRGYDSGALIGAVAAMVQTAVNYREIPQNYGGKDVGAYLPPLQILAQGWGNCAAKSGLLAAILSNWPEARLVGVAAPNHYLVGVLRIPQPGDYYVQYDGLQYVLVEAAGPAWLPPGTVFDYTAAILQSSDYRIEPFFD